MSTLSPVAHMDFDAYTIRQDGTALVRATGAVLHPWPSGWRYVPAPTSCQRCKAPAAGLLSWHDKRGRLNDFAGCMACARTRREALQAEGISVRASRLGQPQ